MMVSQSKFGKLVGRPTFLFLSGLFLAGCSLSVAPIVLVGIPSTAQAQSPVYGEGAPPSNRREIKIQGRLEPKGGILRLSGLPGDKVDIIHARPGDLVGKDKPLVTCKSATIKRIELEAAKLKLVEAKESLAAKKRELQISEQVAKDRVDGAEQMVELAKQQIKIAQQGSRQVERMRDQLVTLQQLSRDPVTRGAIGRIELETKEIEIEGLDAKNRQAEMAAENGLKQAELQRKQAVLARDAAIQTSEMALAASPIPALEKQLELLQLQLSEAIVSAPHDVTVLSVITEVGERIATLPIMEVADLSKMSCVAEVYEADVGRIQAGDKASMKSPALKEELKGIVTRIDRVVGSPQMRSLDPLARTDFRAVRVWIDIQDDQASVAAERLRLQVDVTINTSK
jgi:HlyD family secretion protein